MRDPLLVYDGDCGLCETASRWLVRAAGLPDDARVAHHALPEGDRARVEAAGLRNELKVLADGGARVVGGLDAVLQMGRGTRLGPLVAAAGLPGLHAVLAGLYRLVARNRRVLAPRPSALACACDPDPHLGWNLAFAVLAAGVAAAGWLVLLATGDLLLAGRAAPRWGDAAWKVPLLVLPAVVGAAAAPRGARVRWASYPLWCQALAAGPWLVGGLATVVARRAGAGPAVAGALYALGAAGGAVVFLRALRRRRPALAGLRARALPPGAAPP